MKSCRRIATDPSPIFQEKHLDLLDSIQYTMENLEQELIQQLKSPRPRSL